MKTIGLERTTETMQRAQQERFEEKIRAAGFHLIDTGGNCTALANADESLLITRRSDPEAPDSLAEPITVGYYRPEYEGSTEFPSLNIYLELFPKN